MTEPLDLAAIRAQLARYSPLDRASIGAIDIAEAACDELDRLRAENARLEHRVAQDESLRHFVNAALLMKPVVEAARALVAELVAEGNTQFTLRETLGAMFPAVANYEAQQGEKP